MKVTLIGTIEVDDELRNTIAIHQGAAPSEVTERIVQEFLATLLFEQIRDLKSRTIASKMSANELRRRIYGWARRGHRRGTTPIIGVTDKELVEFMEMPVPSIRWARYWLVKNGWLREGGRRESGKFWIPTDIGIPEWLRSDYGMIDKNDAYGKSGPCTMERTYQRTCGADRSTARKLC